MRKAVVIINEQHKLLPEQEELLRREFDEVKFLRVPAQGWSLDEMREVFKDLVRFMIEEGSIVFASPIPYLLVNLAEEYGYQLGQDDVPVGRVRIFHNDRREKKELPDGRVIYTIARTGWQLV